MRHKLLTISMVILTTIIIQWNTEANLANDIEYYCAINNCTIETISDEELIQIIINNL